MFVIVVAAVPVFRTVATTYKASLFVSGTNTIPDVAERLSFGPEVFHLKKSHRRLVIPVVAPTHAAIPVGFMDKR
jgi:hypothetical protein